MQNKINYKYIALVLGLLVVFLLFSSFFGNEKNSMAKNNMHLMPDGTMMNNDGSMPAMDMGEMTMNDMVNDLKGKTGADLEKAFLNGMIPHHQGAVDMAKILLKDKTIRPEMVKFANEIISAQTTEIEMQKKWLSTWFK
jgi:uncharacterized protein (DUF305 family)